MSSTRALVKVLLPVVVVAAGAVSAKYLIDSREPPEPRPPEALVPVVRCLELERGPHEVSITARGTVVPRTESTLVAEVTGRVTEISPRLVSGGFFEPGEVLLSIDPRDYQLALSQAELEVARSERRLAEEEADAAVARREWSEFGQGEASPLTLREPQVAEAEASLAAALAAQERAWRDLERTQVVAPYPGLVRAKLTDLGQYLTAGTAIATVYAIDFAEVRLPLRDEELAFLDLPSSAGELQGGPPVLLGAAFAGAERRWQGSIVRSEGEIDPATRMVVAVARVEDPYGRAAEEAGAPLAVGLFVEAEIEGVLLEEVCVLPRGAVRDGGELYVLDAEDRLRFVDFELVRSERDLVVVRVPLEEGTRVVISPLEVATEGMLVREADEETDRD